MKTIVFDFVFFNFTLRLNVLNMLL